MTAYIDWEPQGRLSVKLENGTKWSIDAVDLFGQIKSVQRAWNQAGLYSMTLRKLHYSLVTRNVIPNETNTYKSLGRFVVKLRMADYLDWDFIGDSLRNLKHWPHHDSPQDALEAAAASYRKDIWAGQSHLVEVWAEKDAVSQLIERACHRYRVPHLICRGTPSVTCLHDAAVRFQEYLEDGQDITIFYFGDHDPTGLMIDETIQGYNESFNVPQVYFERLGLTRDQVYEFDIPPNPAKTTDRRSKKYRETHGDDSWELDALEPHTFVELVDQSVEELIDVDLMEGIRKQEAKDQRAFRKFAAGWKA